MKYSYTKGIKKALLAFVLFGFPVVLNVLPSEVANLTVGALLVMVANYLKVYLSK